MKKKIFTLFILIAACSLSAVAAPPFNLAGNRKPLKIYVGNGEAQVVGTAISMFREDSREATDSYPIMSGTITHGTIAVGTIGKNAEFEKFLASNNISFTEIAGKWEAFKIASVYNSSDKASYLAVIGSDARGTAYGVLELSRMLGVSPWVWWADVIPNKVRYLPVMAGYTKVEMPSVQYRGIFLNDEDWGLMPWSSKTYEQSDQPGRIGAETYSRIFELLLRLRANSMWPAMHEKTVPFYMVEGAKEAADKYAIVLGASHCEPLMRNNAGEWDTQKYGRFNYLTNRETIVNYWTERLQLLKNSENFFTIGMRGVHDGKMEGVNTTQEYTDALAKVIPEQRRLLSENINPDVTKVPQAFIPYKEVLEVYNNGLKVPDDVTLVWCDDNYGYITRLSNAEEQKRSGGAGVYYHISYWGRPHDYLWLCTTPPAQIYSEMKRAWDYGARKLWILNVGDIKPAEYDTEFFMDLAWNIDCVSDSTINDHLARWTRKIFGNNYGAKIAPLLEEYYALATPRKPEHMGWSQVEVSGVPGGKTPVKDTEYNPFMFGDEIRRRIDKYDEIKNAAADLMNSIPLTRKVAYLQLVRYPVVYSAFMNEKLLYAQKARLFAGYNLPVANAYSYLSRYAYESIEVGTKYQNETLMDGKWNRMMDMAPRSLAVFDSLKQPATIGFNNDPSVTIWCEGDSAPLAKGSKIIVPRFVREVNNTFFISLFTTNKQSAKWSTENLPKWLDIKEKVNKNAKLRDQTVLELSVKWDVANSASENSGFILKAGVDSYQVSVSAVRAGVKAAGYEANSAVGMDASGFSRKNGAGIKSTQGLGHSGSAVSLPRSSGGYGDSAPWLEYDIFTFSTGEALLRTYVIPTHPVNGGDMRVAVSVDGAAPVELSFTTPFRSETWKENVMRNQAVVKLPVKMERAGMHKIRIYTPDNNVIIDQIMLDFIPDRKFYEVPVPGKQGKNRDYLK